MEIHTTLITRQEGAVTTKPDGGRGQGQRTGGRKVVEEGVSKFVQGGEVTMLPGRHLRVHEVISSRGDRGSKS